MFNLQGSEIIIILLLALVVLGPEKLPEAMRRAGRAYAELKRMSSGFQAEFRAAVDEPLRELRDTAQSIKDSADFTKLQSGERPEKPKSADMLAPADPLAEPTTDVPFAPEKAVEPVDGADVGPVAVPPSEQVPFSSVIISGGSSPSTAPADGAATPDDPPPPQPFADIVFSSASPPNRRQRPSDQPPAAAEVVGPPTAGGEPPAAPVAGEPVRHGGEGADDAPVVESQAATADSDADATHADADSAQERNE